ncbi:hypothetical protein EROP_12610 [Erysipelotrichaceae bacterium OPF54]|nr:hypothetical protein EROP_12610 [Erysipelotrichaceae bacterium OPF54]
MSAIKTVLTNLFNIFIMPLSKEDSEKSFMEVHVFSGIEIRSIMNRHPGEVPGNRMEAL